MEKIKYPILLVFCSVFFVAMKRTYPDMLASSRLEYGSKILRHLGYFISTTALTGIAEFVKIGRETGLFHNGSV